ncbi:glycosyltransferase family 2 protein [Vibrio navarrensis]|uniref:glycosyltransferase family 2 protein n=1 Tax=Vibrio navarrensis TaxID=29495 RepID=UPI001869B307|nr:glycosyltransferase family 2 protein [Vibrio navarrensis]MBE4582236.1 hypothetical protein [Vibrio navarrensis]
MIAPVALFLFNRPDLSETVLKSLSLCKNAKFTDLYIFIDGPRDKRDLDLQKLIIQIVDKYSPFFANVEVSKSDNNRGLAFSLKSGISSIFLDNEAVIVLEDDLILSKNFLVYMNQSLDYYKENTLIGSISGFSTRVQSSQVEDVYFHPRPCSWGWGTWKDRWEQCDWEYKPNTRLDALKMWLKTRKAGQDVYRMYKNQLAGRINSWAIMWTIHHLRSNWLVVYPVQSKVINAGFGNDATHCTGRNPFPATLDFSNKDSFHFVSEPKIKPKLLKQVNYYHRNIYKLLFKMGLK